MNCLDEVLEKYPLVVLDGAFATELEGRGFDIKDELWSAKALHERPDLVKAVHLDYLRAGADVVESASYQATIEGFLRKGLSRERAAELIKLSVSLAKEARAEFIREAPEILTHRPKPLVAASVGPYGAFLADGSEYRGNYAIGEEELADFHEERLKLLADEEPDIMAVETLPCLVEAKAVVRAVRRAGISIPLWISFSCKDADSISDGTPLGECAAWLEGAPEVVALGLNCTAPQHVSSLIGKIREKSKKHIVVYPNSGETYDAVTKTWQGASARFVDMAARWYQAGARLIGGCCRTTPDDIRAIADWARSKEMRK